MKQINGRSYSYPEFIAWVTQLVAEGKTSGPKQTEMLAHFTALNLKRMERIYKTTEITTHLSSALALLETKQTWVVITEAWCGDSAQILPVVARVAEDAEGLVDLKIIMRDENPQWIEKYHTNGSHSIPKLVAFDDEGKELFTWGPRPLAAQQIFLNWKKNPAGKTWDEFERELHTWYAKDKTISIQNGIYEKLAILFEVISANSNLGFSMN